jgi:hypothetical protein
MPGPPPARKWDLNYYLDRRVYVPFKGLPPKPPAGAHRALIYRNCNIAISQRAGEAAPCHLTRSPHFCIIAMRLGRLADILRLVVGRQAQPPHQHFFNTSLKQPLREQRVREALPRRPRLLWTHRLRAVRAAVWGQQAEAAGGRLGRNGSCAEKRAAL